MRLEYEIGLDDRPLRRTLRGIENEVRSSARRQARETARAEVGTTTRKGRDNDAHVRARTREIQRIEQAERRAADRTAKYWQDAHRRAADHRIREEQRAERAREREARRVTRIAAHERAELAQRVRGGVARTATGSVGTVARVGGMALGLAGGFAAAGALDDQLAVSRKASQLANQAGDPSLKGTLAREARNVKGFTGSEALGGLEAFVTKTGNLGAARQALGPLSQLALATGSNLEDLGQTAGQVFNVLKGQISDPVALMKELQLVMGTLAQQGSLGAVEIRDLATEFGKLGAASRGFEGGGPGLLRAMGAFAQIAIEKGGASSSADAATAVGRLAGDIVTKKDKFAALGIDIQSKTDPTKLRAPEQIMLDVLAKTGGDIMKTSGLFGLESKKVFAGMAATFSDAEKIKKGSGLDAARAEFKKFAGAESSPESIRLQAESRLSDDDMQLKEATKAFNSAVGEHLAPVALETANRFAALAPQLGGMAKSVGRFLSFMLENPFTGVGVVVGGAIAKDIAGAGLGNIISGEIKGKMGAALNGMGLGLSVATLIVSAGIINFEKRSANIDVGGKSLDRARELATAAGAGDKNAAGELRKEIEAQTKRADEAGKAGFIEQMLKGFLNFAQFDVGTPEQKAAREAAVTKASQVLDSERPVEQKSQEEFLKQMKALEAAAAAAAASLEKVGATSATAPNSPPRAGGPISTRS